MRRVRQSVVALLGAAALGLLSGCSPGSAQATSTEMPTQRVVQPGAPGEPNTTLTAAPEIPDFVTEADVTFVQHMLMHHAQALELTSLVPERTARTDIPLFAERIEISQDQEIDLMEDWLRERNEPVNDLRGGHHDGDQLMPGMLTDDQLARLEAASGEEFDRLFLRFMYQHHAGAVQMVEELFEADGGQDSWVFRLVKEIDGDQRIEMDRILDMQATMGLGDVGTQEGTG
ncbi:DUF305 domain-containing protein [Nostocoides sp. F2B08]|uniref:DUF305 domain-containing protein n=1 Tax=Nostocoides sp. F2B08 TaxID=2653936 RepID=UPI001263931D|nr:DUF305 domain-containing protein [Tetrasphaera sp. F2B08]KAB7743820.1 DUF305 domain-containing protein [Tetrasphaera sp. F2B08]